MGVPHKGTQPSMGVPTEGHSTMVLYSCKLGLGLGLEAAAWAWALGPGKCLFLLLSRQVFVFVRVGL